MTALVVSGDEQFPLAGVVAIGGSEGQRFLDFSTLHRQTRTILDTRHLAAEAGTPKTIGSDPEMFRTFFLPGLTKLSKRYNGIGIHCCAQARHQWENFARIPGLMLMNMQGPDVCDEVYDVLGTGTAHYHHNHPKITADMSEQQMEDILGKTVCKKGTRTVIFYSVKTKEEALRFIDKLERLRGGGGGVISDQ